MVTYENQILVNFFNFLLLFIDLIFCSVYILFDYFIFFRIIFFPKNSNELERYFFKKKKM